jgi:hypothetical protein
VLCYRAGLSVAEADARSLVTTLQVRRALETRGTRPRWSLSWTSATSRWRRPPMPGTSSSATGISLLLTQLAERRLRPVRRPARPRRAGFTAARRALLHPGAPTTFRALVTAAGEHGESAIGYRRVTTTTDEASGFGSVMNPEGRRAVLDPGTR